MPIVPTSADDELVPDLPRDLLGRDVLLAGVGVHDVQQAQVDQLRHDLDTVPLRQSVVRSERCGTRKLGRPMESGQM